MHDLFLHDVLSDRKGQVRFFVKRDEKGTHFWRYTKSWYRSVGRAWQDVSILGDITLVGCAVYRSMSMTILSLVMRTVVSVPLARAHAS